MPEHRDDKHQDKADGRVVNMLEGDMHAKVGEAEVLREREGAVQLSGNVWSGDWRDAEAGNLTAETSAAPAARARASASSADELANEYRLEVKARAKPSVGALGRQDDRRRRDQVPLIHTAQDRANVGL